MKFRERKGGYVLLRFSFDYDFYKVETIHKRKGAIIEELSLRNRTNIVINGKSLAAYKISTYSYWVE